MLQSTSAGMGGALEEIIVIPMSLDDYFHWPEEGKVEWVDGEAFVMPPAKILHEEIALALSMLIRNSLPREKVTVSTGSGFRRFSKYRIPDVLVCDRRLINLDDSWSDSALVIVEVLSFSSFMIDTHIKSKEYAEAGVKQYWIADPRDRTVSLQQNNGNGGWVPLAELSEANPVIEVELPGFGIIKLDWDSVFEFIPAVSDWS